MRIVHQPAFVLHHRPFRETSLIIDLFTEEQGRVSVIAKGVRVARSKTRALLQPFTPLLVSWCGKTELMTLRSVEINQVPIRLKKMSLLSGFYLNEMMLRLLPKHDSQPRIFTLYHETLLALEQTERQQKVLRIFEKKLLEELGYGLQLKHDLSVKPFHSDCYYRYIPEFGFELFTPDHASLPRTVFLGKSLLALANEDFEDEESLRDAKRLMRLVLSSVLGDYVLHSRKLFYEVEA